MIPVQLSYHNEITDVGNWSFVGSNVLVMNESTMKMIYEMNHILNCRCEIKRSYDPGCSTQLIFINCVEQPVIFINCVHNCEDHSFT